VFSRTEPNIGWPEVSTIYGFTVRAIIARPSHKDKEPLQAREKPHNSKRIVVLSDCWEKVHRPLVRISFGGFLGAGLDGDA
jgi:hypothetical protein